MQQYTTLQASPTMLIDSLTSITRSTRVYRVSAELTRSLTMPDACSFVGNPRKSVFSSKAKMKAKTGDLPMETPRVLEGIPVLAMVHFVHFEVYHVGMTERLDLLLPPEGVPANEI
eukprot:4945-Heterococcus_DN1.PRE.3